MKRRIKPTIALAAGAVLLGAVLAQTTQAQSTLLESGTSYLANSLGQMSGSEVISVSWFVLENTSQNPQPNVYTYGYILNNPAGDVELNNQDQPTSTPESIEDFSLTFNANAPGAVLSVSVPSGGSYINDGATGLLWVFPSVAPGTSSALIAFQSDIAPGMGDASAQGANPPAPWSSNPNGQQVPVPVVVIAAPEPSAVVLLSLGLFALLARRYLGRKKVA